MGRLWVFSGREVCGIPAQHGFAEVSQRGSHMVMQKKIPGSTITVPVSDHAEVHLGTLQSIILQPGLPRKTPASPRSYTWFNRTDDRLSADYEGSVCCTTDDVRQECQRTQAFLDRRHRYLLQKGCAESELDGEHGDV